MVHIMQKIRISIINGDKWNQFRFWVLVLFQMLYYKNNWNSSFMKKKLLTKIESFEFDDFLLNGPRDISSGDSFKVVP